jgi:hypothetical protein
MMGFRFGGGRIRFNPSMCSRNLIFRAKDDREQKGCQTHRGEKTVPHFRMLDQLMGVAMGQVGKKIPKHGDFISNFG